MILKYSKVEIVDRDSRFVLKRTALGDKLLMNRKHAVTNQIYSYERERIKANKGVFPNCLYQTYHIFHSINVGWDCTDVLLAKAHAENHNRLFIPFQQRNAKQWSKLDWDESETSFISLANLGLQIVPYPIPKDADIEDWEFHKTEARKRILPSQDIMPILTSRHNEDSFQDFINYEIKKSKLIGIHLYPKIEPKDTVNLSRLRAINSRLNPNDVCALFVGFNAPRRIVKFDSVNSSFAYSSFGIDIFSPQQLSPSQMKAMLKNEEKLKEYVQQFYDITQGGYSSNPDQKVWHEFGLIDLLNSTVTVDEALNKFQTVIWFSTLFEQKDFDELNSKILAKENIIDYITDGRSKWATFWHKYGSTAIS